MSKNALAPPDGMLLGGDRRIHRLDLPPDSFGNSTKRVGRRGRIYRKFHRTISHPHHLSERIEPGDPNAAGEYRSDRQSQSVYSDYDKKEKKKDSWKFIKEWNRPEFHSTEKQKKAFGWPKSMPSVLHLRPSDGPLHKLMPKPANSRKRLRSSWLHSGVQASSKPNLKLLEGGSILKKLHHIIGHRECLTLENRSPAPTVSSPIVNEAPPRKTRLW